MDRLLSAYQAPQLSNEALARMDAVMTAAGARSEWLASISPYGVKA